MIINDDLIADICSRLKQNRRVRRILPAEGRLHIDRQVPFLCVYRSPVGRADEGTSRLIVGEASYMIASGERWLHRRLSSLTEQVVQTLADEFGSFLMIELWAAHHTEGNGSESSGQPGFRILTLPVPNDPLAPTIARLESTLKQICIADQQASVEVATARTVAPPGLPVLLPALKLKALPCRVIGLEVQPIYRNAETGEAYPLVLQTLHQHLARVLKKVFFTFMRTQTSRRPAHYHALGRQAMVKAVWEVDRQLAQIGDSFDVLLHVTPTNSEAAWAAFKRSHFQREPSFAYRPLPVDPVLLKRTLYNIRIERVEDPSLAQLFLEKQRELDQQLSLLFSRGSPDFRYISLQLFGEVDETLMQTAREILRRVPPRSRDDSAAGYLDARAFASRALEEIGFYRQAYEGLSATVHVRDDLNRGMMVSQGNLLIGRQTRVPSNRVESLLHHEIGTHILTYFNGRAQPFRQLHTGLAGYEELQEGIAVLSEYLGGNLSRPRLRVLAARVVAARCMIDHASFVEVFRLLTRDYHFDQRTAFTITMRIYRGGGLSKDAVYLRGLIGILDYLKRGGDLMPLFVGKIATAHIPLIRELQLREVLQPAPMQPRYLNDSASQSRLDRVREGLGIFDLIEKSK